MRALRGFVTFKQSSTPARHEQVLCYHRLAEETVGRENLARTCVCQEEGHRPADKAKPLPNKLFSCQVLKVEGYDLQPIPFACVTTGMTPCVEFRSLLAWSFSQ